MITNHKELVPILSLIVFLAVSSRMQAVVPVPDGGYPNGNTAEGQNALLSLTNGVYNTGIGYLSLSANTANSFNTAIGAGTLLLTISDQNTATGAAALLANTTGAYNTANGAFALLNNTTGNNNVAVGAGAGISLTTGNNNIDIGNSGIPGESDTIRIGDPAIHVATFVAGIHGMALSGPTSTVVVDAAGRLGSIPMSLLYDYSNAPTIPFSHFLGFPEPPAPFVVGDAISKVSEDTFVVNEDGVYRVTYMVGSGSSVNTQVFVNNSGVGPRLGLSSSGSFTQQVTFGAQAGSTVQIEITTGGGPNPSVASINIDKLQ